jgi:ADP-ribose pyrophosphatase YjhB (NUDIX family)
MSDDLFSLEVLTVDGHVKRGKYVSSHLHYNVTYLMEANDQDELKIKEDENKGLRWFSFEDALKASTEPWFVENIYSKLNSKVKDYLKR